MNELVDLQQEILKSLLETGSWLDPEGLIQITADLSESGGRSFTKPDGLLGWIPDFEFISIDVLKPELDSPYNVKGKKGISQLRNLFNKVRFALPGAEKYRLHADTPRKARKYMEWFENDPLVKDSGEFGTKIINGNRVDYKVLDLEVPDLEVLGVDPSGRPIFRRPTTKTGIAHARLMNDAYVAGGESTQGLKPYRRDTKGVDFEIEGKGQKYKTDANPKGYRFGNAAKHSERAQFRRLKEQGKVISLDERLDLMRLEFPGAPEEEIARLAEQIHDYNEAQIRETVNTARKKKWHVEDRTPVSGKKGYRSWHNLKPDEPGFNLWKSAKDPGDEYARTHNIGGSKAEQVTFDRSSPLSTKGTQITPELDRRDIRAALGIDDGVRNLTTYDPTNPIDIDWLAKEEAFLNVPGRESLRAASKASGGLKKALMKAGSILPFVGAGMDAWDVTQRYDEMMNNPNEGFADWLDKTQFAIASATVGTSFWAEPANFALGMSNLGIDAMRTIFEEDKREDFGDMLRGVGRGIGHIGTQLL